VTRTASLNLFLIMYNWCVFGVDFLSLTENYFDFFSFPFVFFFEPFLGLIPMSCGL
jgi:hypothetical protein